MIYRRVISEPIFCYFDSFALLASEALSKCDAFITSREEDMGVRSKSPRNTTNNYSINMESITKLAHLLEVEPSTALRWSMAREPISSSEEDCYYTVAAPMLKGHHISLGSEQRCILLPGISDSETRKTFCIHLAIAEWYQGDWTHGFELIESDHAHICKHWSHDSSKIDEIAHSFRIEWKWPSPELRRMGIGNMYVSIPRVTLRGPSANQLYSDLADTNGYEGDE